MERGEGVRHLHTHSSTGSRSQAVHPHRAHLASDCLSPPSSHLLAAVPCAALFSMAQAWTTGAKQPWIKTHKG